MKAAVFYGPHQPLKVEEVARPTPRPGEVLVRIVSCGVCHTDLHYIDHGVPTFKSPPLILGHEASGIVHEVGEGVTHLKPGDQVLIPPVFPCGKCEMCRIGRENVCQNLVMVGNNVDGAYAEYLVAPAKDCIPLPYGIPLEEGAVISDAISTPFYALLGRAKIQPGDRVVVFGCGGLGLNAIQIARAFGGFVVAVDIREKKLELSLQFGANEVVDGKDPDLTKKIRKLTDGGAHIALEAIGNPEVMNTAFACVRPGGTLVIMGYSDKDLFVNAGRLMYREIQILGSLGCPPVLYPRIIQLIVQGKIRLKEIVTHRFPLDQINEALELLRKGEETLIRSIVLPH
ncbi:MAG: alcohol dehydrogenase catalytic domain-containing protein [bacterium JZ-2024 1]